MANNPYVNKVIYDGATLIDISDTTATANTILEGYTAYGADGSKITGTASGQSLVVVDTPDSHGGTIRDITGKVVHLQTKTVTPTSSVQVVDPDNGYDGFSQVTVNAAGEGTIESLTVTPGTSQQVFNSSSVDGYKPVTVNAMPIGSVTAPSSISETSAIVSTGNNTLTLTKSVSITPNVTTSGYISSGTEGSSSVSLTAYVTTKAATTYHPSTTSQSIASDTYLTGAQTISPVTTTNLSASNIVSGVTIKVGDSSDDDCVASVTGNVVLQNYYTGSSAPSSSLGSNGDLYLQT